MLVNCTSAGDYLSLRARYEWDDEVPALDNLNADVISDLRDQYAINGVCKKGYERTGFSLKRLYLILRKSEGGFRGSGMWDDAPLTMITVLKE